MSRRRQWDFALQDKHREAVDTAPVPRNARVPGSPEWCYQTMSLLKFSYRHVGADQTDFRHYLNELREHRAWEKVPVDDPYGSEEKMLVAELGKRIEEITAELAVAAQDVDAIKAQTRDAADEANLRPAHRPAITVNTTNSDVDSFKPRPRGNSIDAALRRLRHAGEGDERVAAIQARVLAGEITAHAGMVEAGFRKKAASRKRSRVELIQARLDQMTRVEQRAVWLYLCERFK
jgi:hypothetical protein